MHFYRERLFAPPLWWVLGMVTMLTFGAIVWTGFDLLITIGVFAVLIGVAAAFLLNWGRAVIEVTAGELRAGNATLPLALTGEVRALNEAQARALRGPRADPAAYTLIRPYLRYAVYVEVCGAEVCGAEVCGAEVCGPGSASPYWLLATRHPAELAAAIETSRPVVSSGGLAMT